MGIQFFGEFLLNHGVISRTQLLEALGLQEQRNLKFGVIAIQKGYLNEKQIERVSDEQRVKDLKFGDVAQELGLMDKEQVKEILTLQKNSYLYLGEALVELGYVSKDLLYHYLSDFQHEQAYYVLDAVSVPEDINFPEMISVSVDLTRKLFRRVVDILVKVGKARVNPPSTIKKSDFHVTVSISFEKYILVRYVLSVSSNVAVAIASRILKEDATRETEAIIEDAVGEFCSMVCGNVAAKLAQMGIDTNICPPKTLSSIPQAREEGTVIVQYPVHLAEGAVDLRFLVSAI